MVTNDKNKIKPTLYDNDITNTYNNQCQLDTSYENTEYVYEELTQPTSIVKQDYTDTNINETTMNYPTNYNTIYNNNIYNSTEHDSTQNNYCTTNYNTSITTTGFQYNNNKKTKNHENTQTYPKNYNTNYNNNIYNNTKTSDSTSNTFYNTNYNTTDNMTYYNDNKYDSLKPSNNITIYNNAHDNFYTNTNNTHNINIYISNTKT